MISFKCSKKWSQSGNLNIQAHFPNSPIHQNNNTLVKISPLKKSFYYDLKAMVFISDSTFVLNKVSAIVPRLFITTSRFRVFVLL